MKFRFISLRNEFFWKFAHKTSVAGLKSDGQFNKRDVHLLDNSTLKKIIWKLRIFKNLCYGSKNVNKKKKFFNFKYFTWFNYQKYIYKLKTKLLKNYKEMYDCKIVYQICHFEVLFMLLVRQNICVLLFCFFNTFI